MRHTLSLSVAGPRLDSSAMPFGRTGFHFCMGTKGEASRSVCADHRKDHRAAPCPAEILLHTGRLTRAPAPSSKSAGRGGPPLGRFDSFAAPLQEIPRRAGPLRELI